MIVYEPCLCTSECSNAIGIRIVAGSVMLIALPLVWSAERSGGCDPSQAQWCCKNVNYVQFCREPHGTIPCKYALRMARHERTILTETCDLHGV